MSEILALDDDGASLLLMRDALRRAGHRVALTSDPLQALDALNHVRFDLVICSSTMDLGEGFSRENLLEPAGHRPRLLLIHAETEQAPPVAPVLRRPLDAATLTETVASVLCEA